MVLRFEVEVLRWRVGRVVISCPAAFQTDVDSTTRGERGESGGEGREV